jgi:hypothetical protein
VKEANPPASWETKHYYKGVAVGQFEEDVVPTVVNMEPNDLKPYSPECVKCSDAGGNVTITFERRSRITSELHDSDGNVTYREGQGSLAHFVYKIYGNKTLADKPWEDSGSWFLVATYSGATAKWDQQVAIDPSHYADIDAGLCSASGSAYHNSYAGETDSGALYVEAIANDGTTILDRIENSQSHPTVWTQEAAALALPSGTRYLRIGTNNVRSWGTHLESHWDDFALSLFVSGVTLGSTEWNQTDLY